MEYYPTLRNVWQCVNENTRNIKKHENLDYYHSCKWENFNNPKLKYHCVRCCNSVDCLLECKDCIKLTYEFGKEHEFWCQYNLKKMKWLDLFFK